MKLSGLVSGKRFFTFRFAPAGQFDAEKLWFGGAKSKQSCRPTTTTRQKITIDSPI
jgi:hypothetical protein